MGSPATDSKSLLQANYVHRIGRVGRADRMGLAISIVSSVPEKVWYHGCASRGKNCNNTKLRDKGGCAIWYDEPQCAAVIEEHLGVTIPVVDESLAIETGEVDGQVVYGQKRKQKDEVFYGHADILAPSVAELAELEHVAQVCCARLYRLRVVLSLTQSLGLSLPPPSLSLSPPPHLHSCRTSA